MRSLRTLASLGAVATALATFVPACMSSPDGNPSQGAGDDDASVEQPGPDATVGDDAGDAAFDHANVPYDGAPGVDTTHTPVKAELVSGRADVEQLMFAAGEMQIGGEPFAQHFAGRNLNDYDRTYLPPNMYVIDNGGDDPKAVVDMFGFGTAVESYEYSKYHMNNVAHWTTAGVSLANGPVVAKLPGATSLARLQASESALIASAGSDVAGYASYPPPQNNPLNYLGFEGLWPSFLPFASFDPAIAPSHEAVKSCTFAGGYGGIPTIGSTIPEYECAYNGLHLVNRDAQVDKTLVPSVVGLATWKEALWAIDFTSRLHDSGSNEVTKIDPRDAAQIGVHGNQVLGLDDGAVPGTFIGSTPLEGLWGLTMLSEMDNAAEFLVSAYTTADGKTLGGFASKSDATAYDYPTALRWFPAKATITEDESVVPYPAIQSIAITDATSRSTDLAALLLGHAMLFGMTDARNPALGQRIGLQLTFDGAPFAADDGVADGEDTTHDRALAVMRVAFVDLDRMHTVPLASSSVTSAASVTVDSATVANGAATPGSAVTTRALAHVIIGLRQALLSLNASITQYGAADPDPSADANGILNAPAIHPTAPGAATTVSARLRQLVAADGAFVRDVLTKSDGTVLLGATVSTSSITPTAAAATLDAQAAAIRALTEAFLVTNDTSFQDRARAVAKHLETAFYSPAARMYRGVEGGADDVTMTTETFAWLISALRETHKSLNVPGDAALGRDVLESRIARAIKLYLNGWDDIDGDQSIEKDTECLGARMQLGEQSLTGELGRDDFGKTTSDRDGDCVLEIDDAQQASVMAASVHFHAP